MLFRSGMSRSEGRSPPSPFPKGTRRIHALARPRPASWAEAGGILFSTWQATTQAWQAVQRSRSMTIPQRATSAPEISGVLKFPPGQARIGTPPCGHGSRAHFRSLGLLDPDAGALEIRKPRKGIPRGAQKPEGVGAHIPGPAPAASLSQAGRYGHRPGDHAPGHHDAHDDTNDRRSRRRRR